MTSMADCIARGIDFGEIDRARGIAAQKEFDQLFNRYRTVMGDAQAAQRAANDLKAANKVKVAARRHKVLHQLQTMKRLQHLIDTSPDPAAALRNLLEYSEGSGFKGESVRSIMEAYEASINAGIREALEKVGTNVLGNSRDGGMLEDLIRELHGEDTGNAMAKHLAKAVDAQKERMRKRRNAHGGNTAKLDGHGVAHAHDADSMRKAGFQAWAQKIHPLLDWGRMVNLSTGQPFAEAGHVPQLSEVQGFLNDIYNGITTAGWDTRDPSMAVGGKALYAQKADHRVLHFKDGTSWLDYNRDFGIGDPLSALVGGLHSMARDVALMRVLGPSPRAGLDFAVQVAEKRAALRGDGKLQTRVARQASLARTMLAHLDGTANRAEHVTMARFFSGTRSVLTSIQLGSAVISSVTDMATITMAAQTVGMNARNVLSRSVDLMASHATRETAGRMGYVVETLADAGAAMARYQGGVFNSGLPERMSGFTLRATGLSFVTDMRKVAWQMEFSGYMADNADRAFDAIDAPLRKALSDRGITARDWDLLRDPSTHFVADNGANFISPQHWLQVQKVMPQVEAEGLAMRLHAMILEQLEFAIPTASVEGRAMLIRNTQAGTIGGELLRSAMMYKSFSVSLMLGQYRRFIEAKKWGRNRWAYAGWMSGLLLMTGALTVQLKELGKGNDPRPMNELKFWYAAAFQGGGLGIFGDFFAAETNRFGGGIAETIAGPVVAAGSDIIKPVASNLSRVINGQDTMLGRDAANYVRRNTPFLSSAWYARTAYSRIVADQIQAFLDPEAEILWRRQMRQQAKDYGTQPFIPRMGDGNSLRAPDFGNMFGGSQ